MKTAVDANVLIYASNKSSQYHSSCRPYLSKERENLVVANQTLFKFVRAVTYSRNPKPLSLKAVLKYVLEYRSMFEIVYETEKDLETFQTLCEKYKLGSNRVFDTKLVATLVNNHIPRIATVNEKDFSVFEEIKVINPAKLKKT